MSAFRIVRDARGALVHVRTETGECIGCIEVGLYEIVREVIEEETTWPVDGGSDHRRRAADGVAEIKTR